MKKINRTMTILNAYGDLKITWSEEDDIKMENLISSLLLEGYSFFIIKRKKILSLPLGSKEEVKLKSVRDLDGNVVYTKDAKLKSAFKELKTVKVIANIENEYTVEKASTDTNEIINGEVVCVRPSVGG